MSFFEYDLNKSGTITKDEFRDILQMMIGANVSQEQVDSIAERYVFDRDSINATHFQNNERGR